MFAIANARGTGASFGVNNGPHAAETTADSWEIVEWLAGQPWSDGHVGMLGRTRFTEPRGIERSIRFHEKEWERVERLAEVLRLPPNR